MSSKAALKNILLRHYELYPKSRIQDMVKLVYQNEFAGGHMISNEEKSLKLLREEYDSLESYSPGKKQPTGDVSVEIGNGLCRLNLWALEDAGIDIETVNRFFIVTARLTHGSIKNFKDKLDVLRQCCSNKELPYLLEELDAYLNDYQKQGYPAVSHSEEYRNAYSPAYRIVKKEYVDYIDIFRKIDFLLKSQDVVNVAIDGNSGAGKSTLASLIKDVYDCNVFHMDHFFLRPGLKTEERLKETGGNVDYVRFRQEVIRGLNSRCKFHYRVYDCKRQALEQQVMVKPKKLNIIEGSYSMHPTLAGSYHLKIFLQINPEEQKLRILKRNGPFMLKKFLGEWIPLENRYFIEMNIKEQCDLVF